MQHTLLYHTDTEWMTLEYCMISIWNMSQLGAEVIYAVRSCNCFTASCTNTPVGPRGSAVERQSLTSVLSPSCARPVPDGGPLMWVSRLL